MSDGYEIPELTRIETVLDGLSSPTSADVFQATRPYDERAIASVAAQRATAGGSLPNPITTPFNIQGTDPENNIAWDPDTARWAHQIVAGSTGGAKWVDATGDRQLYIFVDAGGAILYTQSSDGTEAMYIRGDAFTELRPVVIQTTAPADAALSAGQLALWFDDTDGAAKLKIKGKSADGTVVTGQVALS